MMKRQKTLTAFIVFTLILSSILAVTYGSLTHPQSTATTEIPTPLPTPLPFQVQVISPSYNYTYGVYEGPLNITADQDPHCTTFDQILPLNITANQETSKITYSLNGSANATFSGYANSTLTLGYGVHNLTAYATNIEGITSEYSVTFNVGNDYFPDTLTPGQVQQTTRYFESRDLKVQADTIDQSKWQNIVYFLYGGSVDAPSKESFADAVIAHGMTTVLLRQDSTYVSYYANFYEHGNPFPIVYTYAATLV
jgi:hypothetical protein